MRSLWGLGLALALALTLRLSPIPEQVSPDINPNRVGKVVTRTGTIGYAKDGSFALVLFAGCLPIKSCGINEPTDWEIGAK